MRDLVRSGDDDKDMEAWMRRTAAMLAGLLIETLAGQAAGEGQAEPPGEADGDG